MHSLVISEWQNNIKNVGILEERDNGVYLNKDKVNAFISEFNTIKNAEGYNYEQIRDWLGTIGIDFPLEIFKSMVKHGTKNNGESLTLNQNFTLSNGIFRNIVSRVREFAGDKASTISLSDISLFDDSSFKYLAKIIARSRPELSNDSFKNGNGDTIYGYSTSRYFTDRILKLKADNNLLNDLSTDPFARHSTWLNSMFPAVEEGAREINESSLVYQYLEYFTADSYKVKDNVIGTTIDKLDEAELEKFSLDLFYNNGHALFNNTRPIMKFLYHTMSDKANAFVVQAPGKYFRLVNGLTVTEKDKEFLVDTLIKPEVERILFWQKNKDKINIAEYANGGGKFLSVSNLNEDSDVEGVKNLWENGELKEDVLTNAVHYSTIRKALVSYLSAEIQTTEEKWIEHGIIEVPNKTNGLDANRMAYIDENFEKTFNPASTREVLFNYVFNTTIANMNMQQLFIGDPVLYYKGGETSLDESLETAINQGKRLAGDNAGKVPFLSNPHETFNLLVIADNKQDSSVYEYVKKFLGEEAEAYKGINTADAQEYTTLEEHINLMLKEGKITEEAVKEIMTNYKDTGKVNIKKYGSILNPYKPVYVNNFKRDGVQSRLYVKSSSIPLIKEFTEDTPLDALRELMENKGIDRVAYKSAVKVGLPVELPSIFTSNGDVVIPDNWEVGLIKDIPREGHGNQQEVPYDANKNEINDGTQQSKILFTNLLKVEGFINPLTGEKVNGKGLSDVYLEQYRQLFENNYKQLIAELGFYNGTVKNVKKLKKLLVDEGIARNYNKNDIASLELNELSTQFASSLWLNTADSKITALLSSIVDNRIRKRKFRGKSFVLVSNAGTSLKAESTITDNAITRVGNWDGELKEVVDENGNIQYAEILIPFKFWDNEGKALKLKEFVNEDGTLDLIRLPEKALEIFGYRIPTSGINLISTIKVVGFLPDSYGDMVIAPPEFVVQMGSDFDVDKLYTQMYNTYYVKDVHNPKGHLQIIDNNLVQKLTNNAIVTKLKEVTALKNAALQNNILDIHKAVLNHTAPEVQYARTRPLGFGKLPEIAKKYFNKLNTNYFSPIFSSYQKSKYLSARAGKAAVGIFSLDMVFNSSLQYVETPLYIVVSEDREGRSVKVRKEYKIAGVKSVALNDMKTRTNRYKSEVIEAYMQAALDNEKEQLLGKLNINNDTFDFIRVMTLLGFEEDIVISLINQPIIKKHLKKSFEEKSKEQILPFGAEYRNILESVSIEELFDAVESTNVESDLQKAVLSLFNEVSKFGRQLKTVQSAINSDSTGVGKNIFYSIDKMNQVLNLPYSTNIPGIEQVLGVYAENKVDDSYIAVGNDVYIKPTSINGFASLYATKTNTEMWKSFYPLDDLNRISQNLLSLTNSEEDVTDGEVETIEALADQKQEVLSLYKQYLISGTYKLFSNYTSDVEARKDLLLDGENHMSLGSIIQDIKSKKIINNVLLQKLQIGNSSSMVDITGKLPTELSYVNAMTLDTDEDVMIDNFVDMIVNDQEIGVYNGEMLTTRGLVDKLITHQLLTSGIQKSGQVIKFIPYNYLKQKGFYAQVEYNHSIFTENGGDAMRQLGEQYLRHNANSFNNYDYFKPFIAFESEEVITLKENSKAQYIVKEDSPFNKIYKQKAPNHYIRIDNAGFKGISEYSIEGSTNSIFYINQVEVENNTEYVPSPTDVDNFLNEDKGVSDSSPAIYNTNRYSIEEKYKLNDNSLSIANKYRFILGEIKREHKNPITKHFAQILFDNAEYLADAPIYVDTKIKAQAYAKTSEIFNQPVEIRVNPKLFTDETDFQNVFVEETVHAMLKKEIHANPLSPIHDYYKQAKEAVINKYGQEAYDRMVNKMANKLPLKEGVERDVIYRVFNVDEFVAGAIKDKAFQELLNDTPRKDSNKSLWQSFIDSIVSLLEKLGVKRDSLLEGVLHESIKKFGKVNNELYTELSVPRYTKTLNYLNNKFNLIDTTGRPLFKGNSKEIATFINKHINNISAIDEDGFVKLTSKTLEGFNIDNSPMFEIIADGIGSNLVSYKQNLQTRIKHLKATIKKAKQEGDNLKVTELVERLNEEVKRSAEVNNIANLVVLLDEAKSQIELVDSILNRDMTTEDMLYAQQIINFWKNAKEYVFDEKHYTSDNLLTEYSRIEALAKRQDEKLFLIQKDYITSEVKDKLGRTVELDEMFERFKDINFAQQKVRDISTYDNAILTTIYMSLKEANIKATDETNELLEGWEEVLDKVVPVLNSMGQKELFGIFRQKSVNGLLTNHLVNPFSSSYYKDKFKVLNPLKQTNTKENMIKYSNWVGTNGRHIELDKVFPADGVITTEVEKYRTSLKSLLGAGAYDYWYKAQERKLNNYEKSKDGYIQKIVNKFNATDIESLKDNAEAMKMYNFWLDRNSPYKLTKQIFSNAKFLSDEGYNSQNFLEVVPKNPIYFDEDFKIIESNAVLFDFYNRVVEILDELKQYVPDSQLETLAYSGIPAIEKNLLEQYREEGMHLGVAPVWDTFIKSMQTSYTSDSVSEVDFIDNKPLKEMRIPIINGNQDTIKKIIDEKVNQFTVDNKREPNDKELEIFREEAVDAVARNTSFDLGKIIKVYTSLVYAHKHKHKVEDTVKLAKNVLNSYKEVRRRPDGSPMWDATTGALQYKEALDSFPNLKSSLDSYINNILYGDVKEEEGKGKITYTTEEKKQLKQIKENLVEVQSQIDNGDITAEQGATLLGKLKEQEASLGKARIISKVGDNALKYFQLKLMGWNLLGGISNMGFGWIANYIEASDGRLFNTKQLNEAYAMVMHSVGKNVTFNHVETDTAKKIRMGMNKWDVLKDASHELYTATTPNSFGKKFRWLSPYNMNQRSEYVNQAPLLIALAKNTKVETPVGEINLWEGYDSDWNWKPEYGEEPKEVVSKLRIRLDQLIKRTHGNYDNMSPLEAKRVFVGRAASQFRTWMYESIAVRFEAERYDDALGLTVKGRYRSFGNFYKSGNIYTLALETLKAILKNYTFGFVDKSKDFNNLINEDSFKEVDAANMRKVVKEVVMALNIQLSLLLLKAIFGDDDESKIANILFNQGTRLRTDLLLYVNPSEARNIIKDIIPAMGLVKDVTDWSSSVVGLTMGEDEVESGVFAGDSRFTRATAKMLPFGAKAYSLYSSASQEYDK